MLNYNKIGKSVIIKKSLITQNKSEFLRTRGRESDNDWFLHPHVKLIFQQSAWFVELINKLLKMKTPSLSFTWIGISIASPESSSCLWWYTPRSLWRSSRFTYSYLCLVLLSHNIQYDTSLGARNSTLECWHHDNIHDKQKLDREKNNLFIYLTPKTSHILFTSIC